MLGRAEVEANARECPLRYNAYRGLSGPSVRQRTKCCFRPSPHRAVSSVRNPTQEPAFHRAL